MKNMSNERTFTNSTNLFHTNILIFVLSVGFLWSLYSRLLFRAISGQTVSFSRKILFWIIIASFVWELFYEFSKTTHSIFVFFSVASCFAAYTIISWIPIESDLIVLTFTFSLIISMLACYYIVTSTDKKRKNHSSSVSGLHIQRIFSVALTMTMVVVWLSTIPSFSLDSASYENKQSSINQQMNELVLLDEAKWRTLSNSEKLTVLQIIADNEQEYLGIPHQLPVSTRKDLSCRGYYLDTTPRIVVNQADLENDSPYDLVCIIAHEAHHAYAHRMVDAYNMLSKDSQELLVFREVKEYKECIAHYISSEDDFEGYYNQELEHAAREYSHERAEYYFRLIYKYMGLEYIPG